MKTCGILCFLLLSIGVFQVKSNPFSNLERLHHEPPLPEPKFDPRVTVVYPGSIEQKLDHFDESNNATFNMTYYEMFRFYKPGGPIFIFVGGEWSNTLARLFGGHIFDMAKELNGCVMYTEHRFYETSPATPDLSVENLQYLTVDQALEDLAHFIRVKRQEIPDAAGVILVGASYGGSMVTWFRQKYPELANGAWSSSAPLLAKMDFNEYYETVGESIKLVGGEKCYNRIEKAFAEMERLVEVGDFDTLSEKFNLCETLTDNQLDISYFFNTLADLMANIVQYHIAYHGDIEDACDLIMKPETDIDGYAYFARQTRGGHICRTIDYKSTIEIYRNETFIPNASYGLKRQWLFQTCNEFGWFQTSGSKNQPFGSSFPVEFKLQWCHDIFGESFNKSTIEAKINMTNFNNNGLNPVITNVYSTHGQLDPWRPMGVQTDLNSFAPTVVIPMASHSNDLRSISIADSPELVESKLRTIALVRQWLKLL